MKFAHVFKQTLQNEGFPPDWVASAISYSQLKKCINRLTNELAQVGLDPPTLGKLLRHVEEQNASVEANDDDRPIKYLLVDGDTGDGESTRSAAVKKAFHPKLLFYINEATGELDSAHLDTPTRQKLQQIAVETGATPLRVFEEPEREDSPDRASCSATSCSDHKSIKRRPGYKTVEIPLTSDSEFFSKLTSELSGLEALQEREEKRMHTEIVKLGNQVATLTDPDRKANKKLLTVWRQLFQIYLENDIFFGTTEADHESRDADKAAERFQKFANTVAQQKLLDNFKRPEQIEAINTFMHINREILQGLRFGEINRTAMMKILKSKHTLSSNLENLRIHQATLTFPRIRQTDRSWRTNYLSPTNRIPRVLRPPRQSCVRRSQHANH
jgi:E3 ubiquitin-protein ligase BAH